MSTSSMCLRTRTSTVETAAAAAAAPKAIRSGSYKYFNRGASAAAADDDYRVPHAHKLKLRPVDKLLKKFRYKEALDAALAGQQPVVVCRCRLLRSGAAQRVSLFGSVLEELASRDGLDIAFAGRDEANLEPVLHFLCKYVADPRFAGALASPPRPNRATLTIPRPSYRRLQRIV
jgi:U3 small nucleolar RNA-associated protein 15